MAEIFNDSVFRIRAAGHNNQKSQNLRNRTIFRKFPDAVYKRHWVITMSRINAAGTLGAATPNLPYHQCKRGASMAVNNLTSGTKLTAYSALFRINRAARFIVLGLHDLEETGIFAPRPLRTFKGLARELQAEINSHLLQKLHSIELAEAYTFGKVRSAREKRLKS